MSELNLEKNGREEWQKIVVFLFCLAYIGLFYYLGIYNRMRPGDDYHFAVMVKEDGFWNFQVRFFQNWTGRILNSFLMSVITLFPARIAYPVLPTVTIVSYGLAVYFLLKTLLVKITQENLILSSVILAAMTLAYTYDLESTVYWGSGMPYVWTTSLFMVSLGLAVRAVGRGEKRRSGGV